MIQFCLYSIYNFFIFFIEIFHFLNHLILIQNIFQVSPIKKYQFTIPLNIECNILIIQCKYYEFLRYLFRLKRPPIIFKNFHFVLICFSKLQKLVCVIQPFILFLFGIIKFIILFFFIEKRRLVSTLYICYQSYLFVMNRILKTFGFIKIVIL